MKKPSEPQKRLDQAYTHTCSSVSASASATAPTSESHPISVSDSDIVLKTNQLENSTSVRHTSFVRLSNSHIVGTLSHAKRDASAPGMKGFSSLRDLGLFAMLSAVLSNPNFTYASGGIYKLLLRHCKNRYFSLHASMRRLQADGFLCRTRVPLTNKKNCFRDYYTLCNQPPVKKEYPVDLDALSDFKPVLSTDSANGVRNLSYQEGTAFSASYRPFLPPTEDFTMISIPMLYDGRLSLSAKGLYAVIARYLRLHTYKEDLVINKSMLRDACNIGDNAFDRLFRELRQNGYLNLTRTQNPKTGYGQYLYTLNPLGTAAIPQDADTDAVPLPMQKLQTADCPDEVFLPPITKDNAGTEIDKNAAELLPADAFHADSAAAVSKSSHKKTSGNQKLLAEQMVKEQIEYDCLKEEFPRHRLDCIVSILVSFLLKASVTKGTGIETNAPKTDGSALPLVPQDFGKYCPPDTDTGQSNMKIGGILYSQEEVFRRLSQLDSEEIRFVLDTYEIVSSHQLIRNVRAYLTTCLFHAKENLAIAMEELTNRVPGSAIPSLNLE